MQEWVGEQMGVAASEDYGLDVEHVETLQQAFDNFLTQLQGTRLLKHEERAAMDLQHVT